VTDATIGNREAREKVADADDDWGLPPVAMATEVLVTSRPVVLAEESSVPVNPLIVPSSPLLRGAVVGEVTVHGTATVAVLGMLTTCPT